MSETTTGVRRFSRCRQRDLKALAEEILVVVEGAGGNRRLLVRDGHPDFVFQLERRLKRGARRIIADEERIGGRFDRDSPLHPQ
jgi:hypothetical protein